ncbi:Phosphoribosylamine--glycine ligase [Labilithrix luteola]|uniref:Phosphoribosylamine--glycine ligase n=1 Tax=Labilithrix luteola TaxID=1391654 RepID=A0A0K1Q4C5_9BACT|nr:class I SAM-dependent methyltransferase [Labilithrix luteola]AKV00220.1 Phosphoribosylamine--glycine ligase [Labilithrix luteola]
MNQESEHNEAARSAVAAAAVKVDLGGIPETMLWTLHNRARESKRPDARLKDPEAVRIYDSIAYDYERSFGRPDSSHPMRSVVFDEALRSWLSAHPGGTVVELACGLETQFQRCDDGRVHWLCVDVPVALDVRERFLPATSRCRHVRKSALDLSWMDQVDATRGVFVTAQGLFMYFDEKDVRRLVVAMFERFPGVELMFDTIPPWFSKKTLEGFAKTEHYTTPPMPWGVSADAIEPLLRGWSGRIATVKTTPYGAFRGPLSVYLRLFSRIPVLRSVPPTIVHVRTRAAVP